MQNIQNCLLSLKKRRQQNQKMDNFANSTPSNYQTIPPTTVMMAGNVKEDSPMRIDEDVANLTTNFSVSGVITSHPNDTNDVENILNSDSRLQAGAASTSSGSSAFEADSSEQVPQIEKKSGSNVIVDESPLQLQMEKNKECKFENTVS